MMDSDLPVVPVLFMRWDGGVSFKRKHPPEVSGAQRNKIQGRSLQNGLRWSPHARGAAYCHEVRHDRIPLLISSLVGGIEGSPPQLGSFPNSRGWGWLEIHACICTLPLEQNDAKLSHPVFFRESMGSFSKLRVTILRRLILPKRGRVAGKHVHPTYHGGKSSC